MTKATKLIVSYQGGSKDGHVEEFPLAEVDELTIGRDSTSALQFDENEDLVSRNHAKIVPSGDDKSRLEVFDLGSSNGTFVNQQRVADSMSVRSGDVVQLGAGGPELKLELDPKPASAAKATRMAGTPAATRVAGTPAPSAEETGKPEIGKATVERMIADTKQKSNKQTLTVAAAILAVVALVVIFMLVQGRSIREDVGDAASGTQAALDEMRSDTPLEPSVIAAANAGATVLIEESWKLIHTPTGQQVYHRTMEGMPAYIYGEYGGNGVIEPWLFLESEKGTNQAIGSAGTGSGFAVTEDGFILTNRHVGANWNDRYQLPLPGRLFDSEGNYFGVIGLDQSGQPVLQSEENVSALPQGVLAGVLSWIPAQAIYVDGRQIKGKILEGRLDYLDVTFPKTKLRVPARLVRISDTADVALIKIDLPTTIQTVELYDNYDSIAAGDQVTVLGYPGISPDVAVKTRSVTLGGSGREDWIVVPDPTVTVGGVGRVYRAQARMAGGRETDYWTSAGDIYQLTINATGHGNSGGPVFDNYGRVVAVFTYGWGTEAARVSAAVPIRYGMELMGIKPVLQ